MLAKLERTWPKITYGDSIKWIAVLISGFCTACGGGGSVDGSFSLSVNVVNSSETIVDWSPYPESNSYRVFRDGQPIISAVGDVAYTDRGLLAGARYCYVVQAREPRGVYDAFSNEVCVTMPKFGGGQIGAIDAAESARIGKDSIGASHVNELGDACVLVAYKNGSRWVKTVTDEHSIREAAINVSSGDCRKGRSPLPVISLALLQRKRQCATIPLV